MQNAFSIVIPLYNKQKHIKRSIESVLNQSMNSWELILVDDCSTDDGLIIAQEILKSVHNAKILKRSKPGSGGYSARNLGVAHSSYDWVAFLDADDEWLPNHLEELNEIVDEERNIRFIGTARYDSYINKIVKDPFSRRRSLKKTVYFSFQDYLYFSRIGANPIQTSAVAMRKDLFDAIGGFPEAKCSRGGDRYLWLRAAALDGLAWSPVMSVIYHRDSDNMVTKTVEAGMSQCCDEYISKILIEKKIENKCVYELKRYSNYERKNVISRKLKQNQLTIKDLKYLYFDCEPFFYLLHYFWCLLPYIFRRNVLSFIFSLKKLAK